MSYENEREQLLYQQVALLLQRGRAMPCVRLYSAFRSEDTEALDAAQED